ncbi:hemerythrin domain-containing protein [Paenibacillus sp. FSL R10-2748]|jgi:hemerythrin-like domain-containing protein|nr:hemerythrin-like domain-containing protein [Paenibacillus sp. PvR133]
MEEIRVLENEKLRFSKPAMRILENEHRYLTYLMDEWHAIVLWFEQHRILDLEEGRKQLEKLRTQIIDFRVSLKKHTEKEEEHFFSMLGTYIGFEQGPLVGIQEEHREIEGYIDHFLYQTEGDLSLLTLDEIQEATKNAGEAFEVLTVHFIKEETVLFPMAEQQINRNDLTKLCDKLNTLIS